MACAGAGAESTAAAAGNLQGITLKVASEIQRDSNNLIFAPPRGSTQNYAQSHNLKVRGSNPLPATK
jgi:hypothetical protein